jgi:hypothetical protein
MEIKRIKTKTMTVKSLYIIAGIVLCLLSIACIPAVIDWFGGMDTKLSPLELVWKIMKIEGAIVLAILPIIGAVLLFIKADDL